MRVYQSLTLQRLSLLNRRPNLAVLWSVWEEDEDKALERTSRLIARRGGWAGAGPQGSASEQDLVTGRVPQRETTRRFRGLMFIWTVLPFTTELIASKR
jgi:hypothetical protein